MSWHYLQGQEEASWEENSLDGAPDALLRLIPTHDRCYLLDNEMECCPDSPYGTTYAHSTAGRGEGALTSCQVVSPVKTSARQASAKDLPEQVLDFGLRCSESLERFNLALCSRKTRRTCVPMGSALSSKDLPAWGMTADGACWELGTRVVRIDATECGFLPTIRSSDCGRGGRGDTWSVWKGTQSRGKSHKNRILEFVGEYLPTPTAKLYHSNKGGAVGRLGKTRYSLETIIGGTWIAFREWMMGWPIGWTALEPLGTDRFQSWLRWHGKFFRQD